MFIKSLKILKNGKAGQGIREITFSKGVNLIVDETISNLKTETGNNIGKTTVLRLIDFSLGGKPNGIYQDSERKLRDGEFNKTQQFLEENKVYVELELTKNLDNPEAENIIIGRNFLKRKNKIQEINGETFDDNAFPKKLAELIFNYSIPKPSFRQIICRNVRHTAQALSKTVTPLHQAVSGSQYEEIYLYWLGIRVDVNKSELTSNIKSEKNYYAQVEGSGGDNLNAIKQKIHTYRSNIDNLNEKKKRFGVNESHIEDLEKLNETKKIINELNSHIVSSKMKMNLIYESRSELDKTSPKVEKEKVEALYAEAKMLMPNLQKRFEDVLAFHNNMIEEKKRFIGRELPQIVNDLEVYKKQHKKLLEDESNLSEKLQKTGAIEEMEILIQQLTQQHEAVGRLEKIKELLELSQINLDKWNEDLRNINENLKGFNKEIENKIKSFNRYFGQISQELYNEKFVVSHDFGTSHGQQNLKLNITGLEQNPGTGKKRGEIIAFDLAYVQFAEELQIPHVNFVLHDQIENIHDNQIDSILLNIVQTINCQYIVPVLQDKLPSGTDWSEYTVLTLSQDDKLFRFS